MPKVTIDAVQPKRGSDYPAPYDTPLAGREARNVAAAGGATDFVANHVVLPPGCLSSQRHWHEGEDELVVMLDGEAILVDDHGRTPMRAGDIAVFVKNDGNGHVLINESDRDCTLLAIGKLALTDCHYPDIDMHLFAGAGRQKRKDGSDFEETK